jgi:hypothetical protein
VIALQVVPSLQQLKLEFKSKFRSSLSKTRRFLLTLAMVRIWVALTSVSARSKARKQSLDLLYEGDIRGQEPAICLALRDLLDEGPDARPIREYTKELILVSQIIVRKIDELIYLRTRLGYGSPTCGRPKYFAS